MFANNRISIFLFFFIVVLVSQSQVFIPLGNYQGFSGALIISDTPSFDYGSKYQNIDNDKTFTISNTSTSPIMGLVGNAFGTGTFKFKGSVFPGTGGTCGTSLQRGATCTIVVTARGSSAGTVNDTISLSYKSPTGTTNLSLPVSIQFNLWGPNSLTNLAVWLDASDSTTIRTGAGGISQATSGDAVSVWQDKSGNNRHANQTTAARQPIYNSTAWTGSLPTITFDGNDDGLVVNAFTMQNYSIGLITRLSSVSNVKAYLTKRTSTANGFFWFLYTSNLLNWDQSGSGNRISTTHTPTAGTDYIYTLVRPTTGTNRTQHVNGTQTVSSSNNPDESNTYDLHIGNDWSSASRGLPGRISELVITTSTLSASDREKLEGYLAWKWGNTAALPGAHPYKSAPP